MHCAINYAKEGFGWVSVWHLRACTCLTGPTGPAGPKGDPGEHTIIRPLFKVIIREAHGMTSCALGKGYAVTPSTACAVTARQRFSIPAGLSEFSILGVSACCFALSITYLMRQVDAFP